MIDEAIKAKIDAAIEKHYNDYGRITIRDAAEISVEVWLDEALDKIFNGTNDKQGGIASAICGFPHGGPRRPK